jgi:hypothetical protein
MLINRNNALIISEKLLKKAASAGINEDEIFQDEQSLIVTPPVAARKVPAGHKVGTT